MARRRSAEDEDDEADDAELDEDDEVDAAPPRRRPAARPRRGRPRPTGPGRSVRPWRSGDNEDEAEAAPPPARRPPVFWRARDSLYFTPLVALAIIVVLVVGMYAYAQTWPPVYVVESDSMQHGSNDVLGVINTGDLVLAQKIDPTSVVTYVQGLKTGYSTYGEYGDVILYLANGAAGTPIIHRAIVYLAWDPATQSYNASQLAGLPCGTAANAVYATPGTPSDCGTTDLTGTLDLYHIGWAPVNVSVDLASPALGAHSGFLTMGDNNFLRPCPASGCVGVPDSQDGVSSLVEYGWVLGVARGMIPWVGAVKLALEGQAGMVPTQSWQFLGLTTAGLILLAFGVHYALRAEGIEDPRRKAEEEAAEHERAADESADDDDAEAPSRSHRFLRALRPWRADDEDEEADGPPARARRSRPTASSVPARRGRPRPRVRRPTPKKRRRADDDDDDTL